MFRTLFYEHFGLLFSYCRCRKYWLIGFAWFSNAHTVQANSETFFEGSIDGALSFYLNGSFVDYGFSADPTPVEVIFALSEEGPTASVARLAAVTPVVTKIYTKSFPKGLSETVEISLTLTLSSFSFSMSTEAFELQPATGASYRFGNYGFSAGDAGFTFELNAPTLFYQLEGPTEQVSGSFELTPSGNSAFSLSTEGWVLDTSSYPESILFQPGYDQITWYLRDYLEASISEVVDGVNVSILFTSRTGAVDATHSGIFSLIASSGDPGEGGGETGGSEPVEVRIYPAAEIEFDTVEGATYLIERSLDLEEWETAGTVLGTGEPVSKLYSREGHAEYFFRVSTLE